MDVAEKLKLNKSRERGNSLEKHNIEDTYKST
jgi:hypothetical protein